MPRLRAMMDANEKGVWKAFDADALDQDVVNTLRSLGRRLAGTISDAAPPSNATKLRKWAKSELAQYSKGARKTYDRTIGTQVYCPKECRDDPTNVASLHTLRGWLHGRTFGWGKKVAQEDKLETALRTAWKTAGELKLPGLGGYTLDALVRVASCRVAVEVERSKNLDKDINALKHAVHIKKADYGVLIVPWSNTHKDRADAGKAQGKLDKAFDGAASGELIIYSIAIVRPVDAIRTLL